MERRALEASGLEARAGDGAGPPRLEGHAAVFGVEADVAGMFRERIEAGAFAETLARDDIRALRNHDPGLVLGRTRAGTLRLSEDGRGLLATIDPPDAGYARDLIESVRRGDVSGMSVGFAVLDEAWGMESGVAMRTLRKVKLYEVSVVTFPAYAETDVSLRSLEARRAPWRRALARRRLELEEARA